VFSGAPLTIQQQFAICPLPFAHSPSIWRGQLTAAATLRRQLEEGFFSSSPLEA